MPDVLVGTFFGGTPDVELLKDRSNHPSASHRCVRTGDTELVNGKVSVVVLCHTLELAY